MDAEYGTDYHERFKKYLLYVQEHDLTVDGAMTDPKGDRGLPPSKQADPDLFLHITEVREDGIVVKGAKCHQTGSLNSHEHIFMPTQALGDDDKDYAVSFAVPSDVEGMFMILGRQSCDTRKLEEGADIDLGNRTFGGHECLVVLDNVFVPNERIFMCRENKYAGMLVERFAGYHRQSYACKTCERCVNWPLLLLQTITVFQEISIKDKIIEMQHLNETMWACSLACSARRTQDGFR